MQLLIRHAVMALSRAYWGQTNTASLTSTPSPTRTPPLRFSDLSLGLPRQVDWAVAHPPLERASSQRSQTCHTNNDVQIFPQLPSLNEFVSVSVHLPLQTRRRNL